VLLAHVLDCEIVHHESERDWPRFVQPEARCVARGVISKWCQTSLQYLVGEQSRLFQTIHSFSNFNVYPTVNG
jgi:hypothetical protein